MKCSSNGNTYGITYHGTVKNLLDGKTHHDQ